MAAGMRRGVPVIVTPEVGAAEIVRKSGAGLVVAGDPEPLGSAIGRLTADLNLARSMGEAGRYQPRVSAGIYVAAQMEDLVCQPHTPSPDGRTCKCLIKLPSSADI